MINALSELGEFLSNSTLSHPNVQSLMKNEKHFDAVIVEVFWVEALYGKSDVKFSGKSLDKFHVIAGFGAHFDCPVIALSTFSTSKWTNDLTKTPMEYSYVAHNFMKMTEHMNFYERMLNTLTSQYENIFMELVHYERQVSQQLKFITFHSKAFYLSLEKNFPSTFSGNSRQSDEKCVTSSC